jgi:hypothetical protein
MSSPDFTNDERFDGLYMNVANTARGIEPLLDTMFSFLRRKTDFFNGPNGQNTDVALAKVNEILQKHVQIHEKANKKKEDAKKRKEKKKEAAVTAAVTSKDDGVIEMGDDKGFDISASSPAPTPVPVAKNVAKPLKEDSKKTVAPQDKKTDDDAEKDEDGPPPEGNGGTVPGKYKWTQTLSEINLTISLPENTRGRDVKIIMKKNHLVVGLKSQLPTQIVDSPLSNNIICDDSFWTVEDGNRLEISLQKMNQMEWWDCVCVGDAKIDVKKVQPENSKLEDLDGDTRQTVEKMMFDQRQKSMGLPTSDEQRKAEMLEKFKKAHPEMDFSNAKIS